MRYFKISIFTLFLGLACLLCTADLFAIDGVTISVWDNSTGGNEIDTLEIISNDSTIPFPYVDPLENDSVIDAYIAGQFFVNIELDNDEFTAWGVAIYTNSNNPTSSSINHPFLTSQIIHLKYHSPEKHTGTPVPGDPITQITQTQWNNGDLYSWLINFTDAQLAAGGLANLDSGTLGYATCIPGANYIGRIGIKFVVGLHHSVTETGTYTNKIGLEVYTN